MCEESNFGYSMVSVHFGATDILGRLDSVEPLMTALNPYRGIMHVIHFKAQNGASTTERLDGRIDESHL